MRILVTGAAGMLGSGLVPALCGAGHTVIATDIDLSQPQPWAGAGPRLHHLDVRRAKDVDDAFDGLRPALVCHLAAETDLERSDADEAHAYATNTLGTKFVAHAARRHGIPMVYISTAGVFDGAKDEPYHEWDDPRPLNVYGKSKWEGERIVEQCVAEHFIIRAGWMVGGGPGKDHKFVAKILDQVAAGARTIHAVGDKLGTPTYVPDFARCFLGLLDSRSFGRYHMVCEGAGSRYDVAAHLLDVLGLREQVDLVEVDSSFFAETYSSVRPRSEIMRNLHLSIQGLNTMRPWQDALAEYLLVNFPHLAHPSARTRTFEREAVA